MKTVYRTVNGRILGHNKAGVATEYLLDPLGSVIGTSTSAGVVSNRTTYWPFGEVRTGGVSAVTPFGFCGGWGYYTDSTGSLYVRARYYRPSLTRWQTVDPLWPDEMAYPYVDAKPSLHIDPSGRGIVFHNCDPKQWGDLPSLIDELCDFYRRCLKNPSCRKQLNLCYKSEKAHDGCLAGMCGVGIGKSYDVDVTCGDPYLCCAMTFGKGPCAKTSHVTWMGRCKISLCDKAKDDSNCKGVFHTIIHELHHCSGCDATDKGEQADNLASCISAIMRNF